MGLGREDVPIEGHHDVAAEDEKEVPCSSARPLSAGALERLAEEERLLSVLVHNRQLVDVANAGVAAARQPTVPLDRLEDGPGLLTGRISSACSLSTNR